MADLSVDGTAFADVPESERARFVTFSRSHPLRELRRSGRLVTFLSGGSGRRTILILTAAHATPLPLYDTVLRLEAGWRVVVIDAGEASSLDELAHDVDDVLGEEGVSRVVSFGQSVCGILAQAYLVRRAARVDALVLAQTVAPRRANNRLPALWLLGALPERLVRLLLLRMLRQLPAVDLPPEGAARRAMGRALLRDALGTITKRRIACTLRLLRELNCEETYGDAAETWPGRVLLVTSEDDAGFADVERVSRALPRTEVHVLPRGAGHLAPLVHSREYFERIERFLASL